MRDEERIAREWFQRVWNDRDEDAIEELLVENSVGHMVQGEVVGREGFREAREQMLGMFPDISVEVEDVVAGEGRAVVRWRAHGTHLGEGMGVAATGKELEMSGVTWMLIADGQLVEGWDHWDLAALLESLKSP